MADAVYEDPREAILARLLELARSIDDSFEARRNETGLPDTSKYVVLFDGEEHAVGDIPGRRNAAEPPPQIVEMTPEVQFRLAAKAKDVGTALNALRIRLIAAVLTDPVLLALTVKGTSMRFAGSNTATERGRSMEGGIGVAFTFAYLLRPAREV
ncbi:MAG: hypothetical protein EOQ52_20405 [Mesorhizobium sp.]|uniref:hypothetical protein n=1 Tax=Mesorhizobium sp. TaxID=1871066 RepID=UPI000FE94B59|nr:hypothetical protein [Mesorhizobium sp.]RWB85916.1 MAG: hypothetical protein EOQ52_20405 [Mesorhizobium sp.]